MIWLGLFEVLTDTGKPGFILLVANDSDSDCAEMRMVQMLRSYGWHVLALEQIAQVSPDEHYSEELEPLIEDVVLNPQHIRLGTLHTYKPN